MGAAKVLALAAALLLLAAALVVGYGRWKWNGLTGELLQRLEAAREAPRPPRFDPAELDGLPPVVQRYFRTALRPGAPIIAAARVEHAGTFDMGEQAPNWKPFTSRQRVVARRPGFVWDGRVALAPGLAVHVHDAYAAGEGVLRPAILGVFTIMELRGGGEVARGELMRFLAEAAWLPTALLPSQGVRWAPVDERSARATLADGGQTLTLTFTFGDDGTIESVRADARGRTVGGRIVPTPWEGRWSDYRVQDGMRVPFTGEVAWLLPAAEGGRKPYWRGTITTLEYEFAQ